MSGGRTTRRPSRWLGPVWAIWVAVVPAVPLGVYAQSDIPVTLRADTFRYDRVTKILVAAGNVVITYQDVVIKADRLRANLDTNDVRAEGNVTIEVAGHQVRGAALDYNLTTRQGRIEQAETEYKGPYVLGTVYVRAQAVEGTLGGPTVGRSAICTTCQGPDPLVSLTAGELSVYPNDKIVGRRVSVWIGGRRLVTWPYFVIYLREQRASRLLPVVGYSQTEGYFLKTFYSYAITPDHHGYLRLDLMDRLGVGYGAEHTYRLGSGNGTLFLYRLENKQTGGPDSRVVINHQQRLGDVTARLYTDYLARYSPVFPETSVYGSLDAFARTRVSSTTLYQSYSSVDLGVLRSSAYTARLIHAQQITPVLSAEVTGDISRSASILGTDDELVSRLTLRYRGGGYLATVVADGRVDLDGDRYPFDPRFGVERLPELTVAADPRLLLGTRLVYQAQVGLARFRETTFVGTTDAVRADATITLTGPLVQSDRGLLDLRAQLRGSSYSTGDARGFVSGRLNYTRFLGAHWQTQVGMTYQDQVGQTPFSFDRTLGRISQADAAVTYRRPDLAVSGTTSFDATTGTWAPAVIRAQYTPRPGWIIASAISYGLSRGTLDRAELAFDLALNPRWQVGYYGYYDGSTGRVTHDRLAVTRIWDECLATAITYRGTTNEFWLETWLTALPWARGRVGIGPQGNILFDQPWFGPRP